MDDELFNTTERIWEFGDVDGGDEDGVEEHYGNFLNDHINAGPMSVSRDRPETDNVANHNSLRFNNVNVVAADNHTIADKSSQYRMKNFFVRNGSGGSGSNGLYAKTRLFRKIGNIRNGKIFPVDVFQTSSVPGSRIRNAITGFVYHDCRVGSRRGEQSFFKVSICTGENMHSHAPMQLFYNDPWDHEQHFHCQVADAIKSAWTKKSSVKSKLVAKEP